MNADLGQLIQLQELDLQVVELQKRIQQIPNELEELNSQLSQDEAALAAIQDNGKENDAQRRRLERDVEDLRQKLAKYKTQLMDVKTNQEYQAMLREIDGVERAIQEKEDEVLERMLEADELAEQAAAADRELQTLRQDAAKRQQELKAFTSEADQRIATLRDERERLSRSVPGELLGDYQKQASKQKNGLAMAEVRNQSCQACHVKVRPQVVAEIRTGKIHSCDSCGRILYLLAPAKPEGSLAEEARKNG